MKGRDAAIESDREFMDRSRVRRFDARDHAVTSRDGAAVVEYGWKMEWESGGETHQAAGREVLVLAQVSHGWHVIWRTQLPG